VRGRMCAWGKECVNEKDAVSVRPSPPPLILPPPSIPPLSRLLLQLLLLLLPSSLQVYMLKRPKTNVQIVQQSSLLKYKYFIRFLRNHGPEIYQEVSCVGGGGGRGRFV
jgi:hypothetical protein